MHACLVAQSCPALCDPMNGILPGSSVHEILQARILEGVAVPSSRGSFQPRSQTQGSPPGLLPPGKPKNTGVGSLSLLQEIFLTQGFPGGSVVKNPPANAGNAGDMGSIPGLGRSPGEGNSYPLQYSCLENLIHGGAWLAIVHRIAKS